MNTRATEVVAKPKVFAVIRQLVSVPLGLCLVGVASLLATHTIISPEESSDLFAIWLATMLLATIGLMALSTGLGSIYKMVINPVSRVLVVWRWDGSRTTYQSHELVGSKSFILTTKYGKFKSCFVETSGGSQLIFTEHDFVNYKTVVEAIASVAPKSYKLKRNFWLMTSRRELVLTALLACAVEAITVLLLKR